MILESDLHNESDPVRSTRAETRQELRATSSSPSDTAGSPFRIVFVLPEGTTPFNCEGTYHFRVEAGMIYIRVRWSPTPENLSSILFLLSELYSNLAASYTTITTVMSDVVAVEQSFLSFICTSVRT